MIYADNAATTRISENVLNAMLPFFREHYGNPSSVYDFGGIARKAVDDARRTIADALGADFGEIYFTSGGTESDNWAVKGAALSLQKKGKTHVIASAFEHPAVLNSLQFLQQHGFELTLLPIPPDGVLTPDLLLQKIRPETGLVSMMFANNEIGTIQPIAEFGTICRERNILFHTDAVQAVGSVPLNLRELPVDLLSLSGHKIHAPKGIGALYIRQGTEIDRLMDGGNQERGRRGGTENVPAAVGLAAAVRDSVQNIACRNEYITGLRERLLDGIFQLGRCRLNGDRNCRLPGNVNVSFENVEGESLVFMLNMYGICASTGSACTSGSLGASHVLLALGLPKETALGSLRLTLSEENTADEADEILDRLKTCLQKLRGSP